MAEVMKAEISAAMLARLIWDGLYDGGGLA